MFSMKQGPSITLSPSSVGLWNVGHFYFPCSSPEWTLSTCFYLCSCVDFPFVWSCPLFHFHSLCFISILFLNGSHTFLHQLCRIPNITWHTHKARFRSASRSLSLYVKPLSKASNIFPFTCTALHSSLLLFKSFLSASKSSACPWAPPPFTLSDGKRGSRSVNKGGQMFILSVLRDLRKLGGW